MIPVTQTEEQIPSLLHQDIFQEQNKQKTEKPRQSCIKQNHRGLIPLFYYIQYLLSLTLFYLQVVETWHEQGMAAVYALPNMTLPPARRLLHMGRVRSRRRRGADIGQAAEDGRELPTGDGEGPVKSTVLISLDDAGPVPAVHHLTIAAVFRQVGDRDIAADGEHFPIRHRPIQQIHHLETGRRLCQ